MWERKLVVSTTSILSKYPDYEAVIGVEVHVQLLTLSKVFCLCRNEISQEANKNICPVCAGHPGVLPVLNNKVLDHALRIGIATNSSIASTSVFDRKHYFYPDLPKNYQITQNDMPICREGTVPIRLQNGDVKNIRLVRIHIEEDAGKNIHAVGANESFVNLNRAGTPLLEIVTYPDMSDAYQVKAYLKALRSLVQSLGICSGNMEDGAFRADTNISVRKKGVTTLGIKCELKNINSFKFIFDATEYEIERQINLLESGGTINQETRLWNTKSKKTVVMRTKEMAADYRYLREPDLPVITITADRIESIKKLQPEIPFDKFNRFVEDYGISSYEAEILIENPALANYFEEARALCPSKHIVNWILRDVMAYVNEQKLNIAECRVTSEKLASLINLIESGSINNVAAKKIFEHVAQHGGDPNGLVKQLGLEKISSPSQLIPIIKDVIANNQEKVALYKSGKYRIFGFFFGQVMKKTNQNADPKMVQEILKEHLKD
jgi:aspartyl-tRNA(Asn)/glutamyl-tRNA(Gln) amidotransferase subunit B